jgi:uncharacterized membrane-anchored protein
MKRRDALFLAALVVPIAAIAAWMATLLLNSRGHEVRLKIVGLDPRDLLAGHYLAYRVDYGKTACSAGTDDDFCVCLDAASPPKASSALWSGSCDERPQAAKDCPVFLKGRCEGASFAAGIERYYFDERFAEALRTTPPDASIAVHITRDGQGFVGDLFVGSLTLKEWLTQQAY